MAGFKSNSPDCCPCTTTPTGCTSYCVNITAWGTSDPSTITATIVGTLSGSPWSTSGSPDGSGHWCYTAVADSHGHFPLVDHVTVTDSDSACSSTSTFSRSGQTCTAYFQFCKIIINCAITDAANPTVSTYPFYFARKEQTAGNVKFTYCLLSPYLTPPFPADCTFEADSGFDESYAGVPLYPSTCKTVNLTCGATVSVDLTQGGDYSGCYFSGLACDLGCGVPVDWGKGPSYRGLIARTIECQWNSGGRHEAGYGSTASGGPINYFADDEGQWITLTGTAVLDQYGRQADILWDSGCRGGMGNFQASPDNCGFTSYLNYDPPYERLKIPYQSTRIQISPSSVGYFRYGKAGCVSGSGRCHNPGCSQIASGGDPNATLTAVACSGLYDSDTGFLCADCFTGTGSYPEGEFLGNMTITNPMDGNSYNYFQRALICSPMDFYVGVNNGGYGPSSWWAPAEHAPYFLSDMTQVQWYCHIREVAC